MSNNTANYLIYQCFTPCEALTFAYLGQYLAKRFMTFGAVKRLNFQLTVIFIWRKISFNMLQIKNPIFITGGSGFIGANLVRRLVAEGFDVHILLRKKSKTWRLDDIIDKLTVHQGDLTDRNRIFEIVAEVKPKTIFHLAVYGAYSWQKEPDKIKSANLDGTINLLDACKSVGFDIFINTGSSSEYGFKSEPMKESDALEPNSHYAVYKAAATYHLQYEAKSQNLPIITLRPFSVYGPFEEPGRLVPNLIVKMLNNECPPLVSPDTARDYIYVDDIVDCYLTAATRPDLGGRVFNMGSGRETKLKEIVDIALEVTGAKVKPQWGTMEQRIWDQNNWQADQTLSATELGWRAKRDLRQGLQETKEWFENNLSYYKDRQENKMTDINCPICGCEAKADIVYEENLPKGKANFSARKELDFYHYQMVRCYDCGLLYAEQAYSDQKAHDLYGESDFYYNDEIKNLTKTYLRYLKKADQYTNRPRSFLEIGAGNGFMLRAVKDKGIERVIGIEPSKSAVDQAPTDVEDNLILDIFRPEKFADESIDRIFFAMLIEHIADIDGLMKGMFDKLKAGGSVVGIAHDEGSLLSRLLKDKCPIINDEHVYVFNKSTLQRIFDKYGFAVQEVGKVANTYSLGYWLKMLPLPKWLKYIIKEMMAAFWLDKIPVRLSAGNIYIVATKPQLKADYKAAAKCADFGKRVKKNILDVAYKSQTHHIGSNLSCADLLSGLYVNYLRVTPATVDDSSRDWFVLSKGHAALAQYAVLAELGFFDKEILFNEYMTDGGRLGAHPDYKCVPGVEMSSGSLGQGFGASVGVALAAKKDGSDRRVVAIVGDGECNEGSVWESVMFAAHHKLDNLTVILDYNRWQAFGTTDEVMFLDPLGDKFRTFGWAVREIDGHDMSQIVSVLDKLPFEVDKPSIIVANTVKGKGLDGLENTLESHYSKLSEEQYKMAISKIN